MISSVTPDGTGQAMLGRIENHNGLSKIHFFQVSHSGPNFVSEDGAASFLQRDKRSYYFNQVKPFFESDIFSYSYFAYNYFPYSTPCCKSPILQMTTLGPGLPQSTTASVEWFVFPKDQRSTPSRSHRPLADHSSFSAFSRLPFHASYY